MKSMTKFLIKFPMYLVQGTVHSCLCVFPQPAYDALRRRP